MALTTSLAASAQDNLMILATSGQAGATNFLDSEIGGWVTAGLGALGAVVIFIGILRVIGAGSKGKMGEVFKIILSTGIIAALLFQPQIALDFAAFLGDLVKSLLNSVEGLN